MARVSEKHFCAEGPGGEGEARLQSRQPQQSNRPGAKLSVELHLKSRGSRADLRPGQLGLWGSP